MTQTPLLAKAYAVVPTVDADTLDSDSAVYCDNCSAAPAAAADIDLDRPLRTVSPEYSHLPEASGLAWEDDFFDDEDGVVAVFDLDYDLMEEYYTRLGWVGLAALLVYPPLVVAALIGMGPCYVRRNAQWSIRAQHVAVTRDGIRFVRDKRKTCWGCAWSDAGRVSKTVRSSGSGGLRLKSFCPPS